MRISLYAAALIIYGLIPGAIWPQRFQISNRQFQGAAFSNELLKGQINAEVDKFEQLVNSEIHLDDHAVFLRQMADATLLASKGQGVDYATNPKLWVVGIGMGAAVSTGDKEFSEVDFDTQSEIPSVGFGFQTGVMGGVNLGSGTRRFMGKIDLRRLRLYAHFFILKLPASASKNFDVGMVNAGSHLQYQWVETRSIFRWWLLQWGGLLLTTGYEYSSMHLKLRQELPLTESAGLYTVKYRGEGELGFAVDTHSIPLVLTTSLDVLLVLTVFGGVGVDLNFGEARTTASLKGDIEAVANGSDDVQMTADSMLDLSQRSRPTYITRRILAGAQLNLLALRLLVYGNVTDNHDYSAGMAFRIAW